MLLVIPALKPPPTVTHSVASGNGCRVTGRLICTASMCWQGLTAANGSGCAAGHCPHERRSCCELPHTALQITCLPGAHCTAPQSAVTPEKHCHILWCCLCFLATLYIPRRCNPDVSDRIFWRWCPANVPDRPHIPERHTFQLFSRYNGAYRSGLWKNWHFEPQGVHDLLLVTSCAAWFIMH